jgi:hypothetical protein
MFATIPSPQGDQKVAKPAPMAIKVIPLNAIHGNGARLCHKIATKALNNPDTVNLRSAFWAPNKRPGSSDCNTDFCSMASSLSPLCG